jgi:cytochrome P450
VAAETTTINGVTIPKGMLIAIPIYAIQNDPEYWPQPKKFDPDRYISVSRI